MAKERACLVACSGTKRDTRTTAFGLYNSTLFEKSWAAASLLGDPFVISAKHGLLTVDDRLDPYDETLKNADDTEKLSWARDVLSDLPDHYDQIVIFGGRDYATPIKEVSEIGVVDVYEGTSGNGKQMSLAGDIVETELSGGDYL